MASLMDLYQAPSSSPALTEAGIFHDAGTAAEDAGLKQALAKRQYETRTIPDIKDRQAGRAAFFSSATSRLAGRAAEDYSVEQADTSRLLARTMADLQRRRILAALGVSV